MSRAAITGADGGLVVIGKELGRGGEGAVYEVNGRADVVAKIYHLAPKPDHSAKLTAMAAIASDRLVRLMQVAAWPTGTLHSAGGSVIGFLMPNVGGHRPVFKLYGPKLRLQEFPRADWRFLIHVATNVARAFSTLHSAGLVVGDVNHGNLVVAQDGMVRLIDCDSFQISAGRQTWYCPVGVGTHQPPELQNINSYSGILRTANHDNFGIAVIIFQLLCIARHPFAGRHLGAGEPPSIEEAIARSRYAYSRDRSRTAMAPPPGSLPIDALTPGIQDLLETAFSPISSRGGRPTPEQWVVALTELSSSLRQCSVNHGHHYRKSLSRCPWCDIEAATGARLFPAVFVSVTSQPSAMLALWQQVTALTEPQPLPPPPDPHSTAASPSLAAKAARKDARAFKVAAFSSTGAVTAAVFALAPMNIAFTLAGCIGAAAYYTITMVSGPSEFKRKFGDAQREWNDLHAAWIAPLPGKPFAQVRTRLNELKASHDALQKKREQRLQTLTNQMRQKQLQDHLDRFAIANARISGIARAKIVTLSAYNIDTAGDIDENRIMAIPGFGPATTAKLLAWRSMHELSFRFDQNKGVSQSELAKVERDIFTERNQIETEVAAGLAHLRATNSAAEARRRLLEGKAAELLPKLAQARADADICPTTFAMSRRAIIGSSTALVTLAACAVASGFNLLQPPHLRPPKAPLALAPVGSDTAVTKATRPFSPQMQSLSTQRAQPPAAATGVRATSLQERVMISRNANVRAGPNRQATVLRIVLAGSVLKVFARQGSWVQMIASVNVV